MKSRARWAPVVLAAMVAAMGPAGSADAAVQGFTGPYAPGTWSTAITGGVGGAVTVDASMLTLTGGDAPGPGNFLPACLGATTGFAGPCEVRFTNTTVMNPFTFDWSYATMDDAGPGGDLFGMLIDGARVQLSDPGGPLTQSGRRSVAAGSSFGWYLNCTDCIGGAATASITNFVAGAAVPEPATMALVGIGALLAMRRRRSLR